MNVSAFETQHTGGALFCSTRKLIHYRNGSFYKDVQSMNVQELKSAMDKLLEEIEGWFTQENISEYSNLISFDMRYLGEPYDLEVALPSSLDWNNEDEVRGTLIEAFHRAHRQVYNFEDANAAIIIQNVRVRASGNSAKPVIPALPRAESDIPDARGSRLVYMGEWTEAKRYHRTDLQHGHEIKGPCIVEQNDTTTVILPGFIGRVDPYGNIVIEKM